MRPRTVAQTDTQTRVNTIHFASSTTHAKCNDSDDMKMTVTASLVITVIARRYGRYLHQSSLGAGDVNMYHGDVARIPVR